MTLKQLSERFSLRARLLIGVITVLTVVSIVNGVLFTIKEASEYTPEAGMAKQSNKNHLTTRPLQKCLTGIKGLDKITGGGLPPDLHRQVYTSARSAGKSINVWIADQLKQSAAHAH